MDRDRELMFDINDSLSLPIDVGNKPVKLATRISSRLPWAKDSEPGDIPKVDLLRPHAPITPYDPRDTANAM